MGAVSVAGLALCLFFLPGSSKKIRRSQTERDRGVATAVPKTWDDAAMATLELPLANPIASPRDAPASYYYKIPVRPIYKSYPIYAPGHEPPGYMDWLKRQEPQVVWGVDPRTGVMRTPPLKTKADWIKAGEMVFDAAVTYESARGFFSVREVRDPAWWVKVGARPAKNGTLPGVSYVVRKKGEVEVGDFGCATCRMRLMPDGTVVKGAQGNLPVDRAGAYAFRATPPPTARLQAAMYRLYGTPWLNPDPHARLLRMPVELIAAHLAVNPPEVDARRGTSMMHPVQIPDLIGVKDRRYLDHTGLVQQRSIADLMRYAALNQGGDALASFDGFIPVDFPDLRERPDPADPKRLQGRYSDEQLYALAL